MYLDDIKLCTDTDDSLKTLLLLINLFNLDIRMKSHLYRFYLKNPRMLELIWKMLYYVNSHEMWSGVLKSHISKKN